MNADWANQSILHPLGLTALLILGMVMLTAPRRYAVLSLFMLACFVAPAQRLVVMTLDFNLLRIMVLIGLFRVMAWGEFRDYRWTTLDTLLLLWTVASAATYTFQHGTVDAFINRLGASFDAVGFYVLLRCLIRNWADVDAAVCSLAAISLPVSVMFLFEHATGRNPFAIFGGVPEVTLIREGRLRCQGAFAHPIIAGCFWATVVPMFVALVVRGPGKLILAVAAMIASSVIIITTASSTPIIALALGIGGMLAYVGRHFVRYMLLGGVVALVGLQLMMQKPIWHLLARVNVTSGSTGWHRYKLIDQAIEHFNEWWLVGTQSTGHWGAGLRDVTNHYLLEGLRGGLVTMVLFMLIIVAAFFAIGRAGRRMKGHAADLLLKWSVGVGLFVHAVSFVGLAYFGQMILLWYFTLAIAAGMASYPVPGRRAAATVVNTNDDALTSYEPGARLEM